MGRFDDKVVLVTGAASGIGQATALRIASEGGRVACVDVQSEAVESTAKQARELGGEAIALAADVSSPESVREALARTLDRYSKLDSLCNIAGILHFDNTHELALERWNQVIAVNLTGTFLMCQSALPHLLETRGNMVNMASTAALTGHPWTAAYTASKGGVLSLTRMLAVEYGKQGLRANAVCPGSIKTPMQDAFRLPEGGNPSLIRRIMPLDGPRGPETAAAVVCFLASPDSEHVNGESLRVDGGALA